MVRFEFYTAREYLDNVYTPGGSKWWYEFMKNENDDKLLQQYKMVRASHPDRQKMAMLVYSHEDTIGYATGYLDPSMISQLIRSTEKSHGIQIDPIRIRHPKNSENYTHVIDDKFLEWCDRGRDPVILEGAPGSGKTSIIRALYKHDSEKYALYPEFDCYPHFLLYNKLPFKNMDEFHTLRYDQMQLNRVSEPLKIPVIERSPDTRKFMFWIPPSGTVLPDYEFNEGRLALLVPKGGITFAPNTIVEDRMPIYEQRIIDLLRGAVLRDIDDEKLCVLAYSYY